CPLARGKFHFADAIMDSRRGELFGRKRIGNRARSLQFEAMSPQILEGIKSLLATPEPPELGPGPRDVAQSVPQLNAALEGLFVHATLSQRSRELVRAAVLLWHDHLDAAHLIAQAIDDRDGSFVHAIMHRREPDYSNAKYWLRHTGAHPCFL